MTYARVEKSVDKHGIRQNSSHRRNRNTCVQRPINVSSDSDYYSRDGGCGIHNSERVFNKKWRIHAPTHSCKLLKVKERDKESYDDDSGIERRHQFISFRSSGSKRYHDHPVREVEDDLLASHPAAEDYENADEQEQGENIEKHVATHYEGEEYNQIALDTVLATSPLKAFDLIFKNEDFMKNFWTCNQKVKGV